MTVSGGARLAARLAMQEEGGVRADGALPVAVERACERGELCVRVGVGVLVVVAVQAHVCPVACERERRLERLERIPLAREVASLVDGRRAIKRVRVRHQAPTQGPQQLQDAVGRKGEPRAVAHLESDARVRDWAGRDHGRERPQHGQVARDRSRELEEDRPERLAQPSRAREEGGKLA